VTRNHIFDYSSIYVPPSFRNKSLIVSQSSVFLNPLAVSSAISIWYWSSFKVQSSITFLYLYPIHSSPSSYPNSGRITCSLCSGPPPLDAYLHYKSEQNILFLLYKALSPLNWKFPSSKLSVVLLISHVWHLACNVSHLTVLSTWSASWASVPLSLKRALQCQSFI